MLIPWVGQMRWVWAALVGALALAAVIEVVAPASVRMDALSVHMGWVLGLLVALLTLLASVTLGRRVASRASPQVDRWFLLTVGSWLLAMVAFAWEALMPTTQAAGCLLLASYLLTGFAAAQFLLWSASVETRGLRVFVWAHGTLALVLLLVFCAAGRWNDLALQAWRILNVVACTVLLLGLGRVLLSRGGTRSWLVLGGGLWAFGVVLSHMSATGRQTYEGSPVHYLLGVYLLMLWLLVSRRMPGFDAVAEVEPPSGDVTPPWAPGPAPPGEAGSGGDAGALQLRRRIAQDLHDGVGSQIVGIISSLDASDARQQAVASALEQCLLDVKILVDDIEDAHENVLDALGRLRYRVQHSLDRMGMVLVWEVDFDGPLLALNDERSRQVLHVAQEALANVMRHSGASRVRVRCHAPPPGRVMVLEVHDDGAGFDPPSHGQAGGKGLTGMHRRARSVGGHLEVLSEPGCGTSVRMTLPL